MSIVHHESWPVLAPFLRLEYVGRDPRRDEDEPPRYRIEVSATGAAADRLLVIVAPCVSCGTPMSPIRRRSSGRLYFAATCEYGLSGSCSKGTAARAEYLAIREAINGIAPHLEPSLFDLCED